MGKAWYQSKTILFNLATFIVLVGGYFTQHADLLQKHPRMAVVLGSAAAFANIVLRFVTATPIKDASGDK